MGVIPGRVGCSPVISDDSDDDDEFGDAIYSDLTAPGYHVTWVPNNQWVSGQEMNQDSYTAADTGRPMGFIPLTEHNASVETDESAGEESSDESTVGQPGMGKVINGMDTETERKLFGELYDHYGNFTPATVRGFVGVFAVLGSMACGIYIADAWRAIGFIVVAGIAAYAYLREG